MPRALPIRALYADDVLGAQKERSEMAESILERREQINVIVTTYDLAAKKEDNKFLRRLRPDVSFLYPMALSLLTFSGMRIVSRRDICL